MKLRNHFSIRRRLIHIVLYSAFAVSASVNAFAHPLGNFTINHYARLEVGSDTVKIHGVIDMAEIPAFQELQKIDIDQDGQASSSETNDYAQQASARLATELAVTVAGERVSLVPVASNLSLPTGAGGLQTLRLEFDLAGRYSAADSAEARELRFADNSYPERIGWREIVVVPQVGFTIFNSTACANGLSDELKSYPQDRLTAPLDERTAQLSFTRGPIPTGAQMLTSRDGRTAPAPARDRLAELIAVQNLTPGLVLLGLLFAVILGAAHALSPGHGKTVVGAYLVGSRGTARHAAFLGLTVTITHTAGVFALGVITLLASAYVVPEKLFPILSLISGGIVVAIGLSLFVRRLRGSRGFSAHHHPGHDHDQDHRHAGDPTQPHSHGGRVHSHLPPGADGSPITWKSLLALGVSGGILPCPSALVVLLAAISLHRVGYGLLLVLAFSVGLASVLTVVGLAFVYAGRLLKSHGAFIRLSKILPIASAFVITCAGLAISYQAFSQAGIDPIATVSAFIVRIITTANAPSLTSLGALGLLGLGLVYGLKHATEVDHIVAVSTIVSEHKKLGRAAIVGGLWGAGHTASLVVVGTVVLGLRVAIPERVAGWLEFCVALMIISLGVIAFRRALQRRTDVHLHQHGHGDRAHRHVHFHDQDIGHTHSRPGGHSHAIATIGLKPGLVGAMHGLAGSGALTLLVLTQINSPLLGLIYLAVFGIGSIFGMLLMSALVGLPFVFSSRKFGGVHYGLQALAGILSIGFGIWYAYETGFATRM